MPTVLAEHGDMLYWVESSPDEGPRIMRAPKDGSGKPEKIGTRSTFDVAEFSASGSHVFWQDNGALVAFDLARSERKELGRLADDGYGGPSLAIGEEWAAFADSSCRSVVTVNLKSGELFHAKVHADLRGGNTSLAVADSAVICGNGPEIVRVETGSSSSGVVWSTSEATLGVFGLRSGLLGLVFQLARFNASNALNWTSLYALDLSSREARMVFELDGAHRMYFAVDVAAPRVFFNEAFRLKPLEVFDLESGKQTSLSGDTFLKGPLIADVEYLYWSEATSSERPNPKNAVYRQRKPE